MKQVQTALELYFSDHNEYPSKDTFVHDIAGAESWENFLGKKLEPYLQNIPHDPLFPNLSHYFMYTTAPTPVLCPKDKAYTLVFTVEASSFDLKPVDGLFEGYCLQPD